ncbi:MAG: ArsI/CadI family heavy metal resistance metalloenzyme [Gammaproteobacteria bacterium]
MKRFHVHMNVADLGGSIRFYSQLFGIDPAVRRHDYAKWMLDDPRVNFAISVHGHEPGIDHLGLQAETDAELAEIGARLAAADAIALTETDTTCCYARSDKFWAQDPQGTRWESFRTFGEATTYYAPEAACSSEGACGIPEAANPAAMTPQAKAAACCAPTARRSAGVAACCAR